MECKNCGALLPEGVTLCPDCGTENAQPEVPEETPEVLEETPETLEETSPLDEAPEEKAPINKKKLAGLIVAAVAVIAIIVVAVSLLRKPAAEPDPAETQAVETTAPTQATEATEPHVFTPAMSDEEAAAAMQTVVGHSGDRELTNGMISAAYWMSYYEFGSQIYNYYGIDPSYFGLDAAKPLDQQECSMVPDGGTWQDYFLGQALDTWKNYLALEQACAEQGITLDPNDQAQLDALHESLAESATRYGFASPEEMLKNDFGAGVTMDDYKAFLTAMLLSNQFYAYQAEHMDVTDEEVEAYYDAHVEDFNMAGVEKNDSPSSINVRHILITPEGEKVTDPETGVSAYSEEQMANARAQAQIILDAWLAGEATEDSFAALAGEHSQDPGSVNNGGLYTDVTPGQMVPAFNDWCFDPARQIGDTGLVETNYGIHIMYFSAVQDPTPYWLGTVKQELTSSRLQELADAAVETVAFEVTTDAIVLSEVDIASAN